MELVAHARAMYLSNPYDVIAIRNWARLASPPTALAQWKIAAYYKALLPEDVVQWEQAIEDECHDMEASRHEKAYLYLVMKRELPLPKYYDLFLDYCDSDVLSSLNDTELFGSSYLHDFADGDVMFERMIEFFTLSDDFEKATACYLARLLHPHKQLQDTYQDFSKFVSENIPDSYNELMREASQVLRRTEKQQRHYEKAELDILQSPDSPNVWQTYMTNVARYGSKDGMAKAESILFRSLVAGTVCKIGDEKWISVWQCFFSLASADYFQTKPGKSILLYFIKCYPDLHLPYTELLQNCSSLQEYNQIVEAANDSSTQTNPVENWANLIEQIIVQGSFCRLEPGFDRAKWVRTVVSLGKRMVKEYPSPKVKDAFQILASVLAKLKQPELRELIEGLVDQHPLSADAWVLAMDYNAKSTFIVERWFTILQNVDNVQRFLSHLAVFQATNGNRETYRAYLAELASNKSQIDVLLTQSQQAVEDHDEEEFVPKKQKVETTSEEPTRSREQFRIKLSPLSKSVTEQDIRDFLKGYGDPVSVNISEAEPVFALVELSSELEVLTCLTRDIKPILGEPVRVARIFGSCVWITNYPSHYDFSQLAKMIEQIAGETPIDIRFPSQNDNRERRFCYADFESEQVAAKARNKLHDAEVDGFHLQAEVSNPTLKKQRQNAPSSQQVYVHNMNFKSTTEQSLRSFFSKFGDIQSIKVPLSENNKAKGNLNNGYAFVTFNSEEAAKEAIKLGAAHIDNRKVEISRVKTKAAQQTTVHFAEPKTVSIQNVNEKVTSDQLKVFLEEKVGAVARVQLRPSKNAALVEFETVNDAGKASIALEGVEYLDNILHVGLKLDYNKGEQQPVKVPAMMPPMLMRRKRK